MANLNSFSATFIIMLIHMRLKRIYSLGIWELCLNNVGNSDGAKELIFLNFDAILKHRIKFMIEIL